MKLHEEFKLYENMWDEQTNPKHKRVPSAKLIEKLDIAELATRGDRSQEIVGDDPYNGDMLYLKDLNELAEYATVMFGETNGDKDMASHTPSSFRVEVLEDSDVKMSPWVRKALEAAINTTGFTLLRDGKIGDPSAHIQIKNIMETLHYDNGKPLSSKEYDYFDHYDRDQDFGGFYEDDLIYDFITDGKNLYVRIDMSFDELEDQLTYMYDGASWDHDFDESFKPHRLTEASSDSQKAYFAMMRVQDYIQGTLGWNIIDCQQDDEYSMMLYCDGAWDDSAIEDLEDFASDNGVDISVADSEKSSYDYRVYLSC